MIKSFSDLTEEEKQAWRDKQDKRLEAAKLMYESIPWSDVEYIVKTLPPDFIIPEWAYYRIRWYMSTKPGAWWGFDSASFYFEDEHDEEDQWLCDAAITWLDNFTRIGMEHHYGIAKVKIYGDNHPAYDKFLEEWP